MRKKIRGGDHKIACMFGIFPYESDVRVQNYVNALTKNGFSVDIICQGENNYTIPQDNGTLVSVFPLRKRVKKEKHQIFYLWDVLLFLMLGTIKISFMQVRRKYKFIHVHNPPDFLVFAAWLPKLLGARIILDIHDILPEFYTRKFRSDMNSFLTKGLLFLEKASCRFSDHVIIANDVWRNTLIGRAVQEDKCTAVINFVDMNLFSPKAKKEGQATTNSFTIMYHGSYTEHHGLDVAVKAVDILRDKIEGMKFVIYGEGSYKEKIKQMVDSRDLGAIIEMNDHVPITEVPRILNEADIGVVPKKDGLFVGEALSTKLFQYVAMEIPAVVSRTIAEKRYFDEDEVKYFTPDDPEDMAQKILEYYQNPKDRVIFAQKALRRMEKNNYNIESSARAYLSLLDAIVRKRSMSF